VARLPDDVPAHKALNCQVNLSLGRPPSSQWHHRPGRPRNRWVDQIRNDNHLRSSRSDVATPDDNNSKEVEQSNYNIYCKNCKVSTRTAHVSA